MVRGLDSICPNSRWIIDGVHKLPILDNTHCVRLECYFCGEAYNPLEPWKWEKLKYVDEHSCEYPVMQLQMVHVNCHRGDCMYRPLSDADLKEKYANRE
jgi:hypothetical protein